MPESSNFNSLCRFLRKAFPTVRVSVRIRGADGYWAFTEQKKGGEFVISMSPTLCEGGLTAWLIHEYAHVLSFHTENHESMHSLHFGSAYSIVWEKYNQWCMAPRRTRKKQCSSKIMGALRELIEPAALARWIATPNASFGGKQPQDMITAGDTVEIWRMIEILRSGMPS